MDLYREVERLIRSDRWRMRVLNLLYDFDLEGAYVTGAFVRDAVWDAAHERAPQPVLPVRVTYLDASRPDPNVDGQLQLELTAKAPNKAWLVENAARWSPPARTMDKAIAAAPDTARAVGVKLARNDGIEILAPHGLEDLFALVVRPTPSGRLEELRAEGERAGWARRYPHVVFSDQ